MRIAVIGAGIVGVTTAHELASDGHEVIVIERREGVSTEGSFANAGLMTPGHGAPWPRPGLAGALLASAVSTSTVRLGGGLGSDVGRWLWRWWRHGHAESQRRNQRRLHALSVAGLARQRGIQHRLQLETESSQGVLLLLRRPRDLARWQAQRAWMTELGVPHRELSADDCRQVEPGLNPETPLHRGLHLSAAEVGNARQYAHHLRAAAQRLGARFHFHCDVTRLDPGPVLQLVSRAPRERAVDVRPMAATADDDTGTPLPAGASSLKVDAVVVCAALASKALLAPLGLHLPLMAVHGYSVTAGLRHDEHHPDSGPRSAVIDLAQDVSICRLGNRVRVAGGFEIGGDTTHHHRGTLERLHRVLHDWYPGVAQAGQPQVWKGARPMLPDDVPVIGPSGTPGVWLNLGHGSAGWQLATGSARLLADLLGGATPGVDPEGFGVDRLRA